MCWRRCVFLLKHVLQEQKNKKKKTVEAAEAQVVNSEVMSFVVDINRASATNAKLSGTSSTKTENANIYQTLKKAAQDGDIERLYHLIAEDPNILDHFDKVLFCETPLHIAAERGQTHFAMELMTLKPSFAWKLNVSGFSPMHLALQNNHVQMVRGFVAIDSSLVSIKGKGRITPLHHVARIGDAELLSEFLIACPSSIEDLTIKCETAVHIATKNEQLITFKVLLGWVKRVNMSEILDWKDEDGNTAFHIAALRNQTEVIKLLRKTVKVEAKNLDGKTAMDILQTPQTPQSPTKTLAKYFSENLSFVEKRNNLLGQSNLSMTRNRSLNTSNRHDAILVVAILLATATYQAGFSPPGGLWQQSSEGHKVGQMIMPFSTAFGFLFFNGLAFILSLYVIIILIVGLPMWKFIYGSMAALSMAMLYSYSTIFPSQESRLILSVLFITAFPVLIGSMLVVTFNAFNFAKRGMHQVDFPASCFSSSNERRLHFTLFSDWLFYLLGAAGGAGVVALIIALTR